jgi:putative DNA primase/helicase
MKTLPCWVLWKLELKGSRQTKVPYTIYHEYASSTNPKTWTTFENVSRVYESSEKYSGIGFVFTEENGIIFVDIDHCFNENREGDDRAKDILSAFNEGTFAEVSQSGTGVHIFAKGTIPRSFKNDRQNVEMYSKGRFCAMTGNALYRTEVNDCQTALDYVFEEYRTPERKKTEYSHTSQIATGSELEILNRARKSEKTGQEFSRLFDSGDWNGLESQSNADYRLCVMLAFWCDRDYSTIDSLFRQSALCREKWIKREDYRTRTIERACGSIEESYSEFVARKRREDLKDYEQFMSEWRIGFRHKTT